MIEAIHFDARLCADFGLRRCEIHGLKDIVVLAGPNGHGKSRYLRVLASQWQNLEQHFGGLLQHLGVAPSIHELRDHELEAPFLELLKALTTGDDAQSIGARERIDARMKALLLDAEAVRNVRLASALSARILRERKLPALVYITHSQSSHVGNCYPMNDLVGRAHSYLHEMGKRIYLRDHPKYAAKHAAALAELDSFQLTLRELLGTQVECGDVDDRPGQISANPLLFGRPLKIQELSEGQRILLGWAILIHQEAGRIRDAILVFDEPELHLHPEACIRAIDSLSSLQPVQIWVATHSLPLLAYAGADRVFSVEDGAIAFAGNRIVDTQQALVGGREGRARLREFLADADAIAYSTYAAQCLVAPESVASRTGDPQPGMLLSALQARVAGGEQLRVLDYAAGQGRIAQALGGTSDSIRARLRYYAYNDPDYTSNEERTLCRQRVAALGQGDGEAYYAEDLRERQLATAAKMDIVLLCNVLHEIPHSRWMRVFEAIARVLAPEGKLVVMEDQRISVGELPHAKGFLVLDVLELTALFSAAPGALKQTIALDGRLTLIEVPRDSLLHVTPTTIHTALELVAQRALDGAQRCRRETGRGQSHARGREHAFFTMLYANAHMALQEYASPRPL